MGSGRWGIVMEETWMQFGVAGLMGALWVWERTHSRKRERQLTQAHDRLIARDQQIGVLIRLVRQNTRAIVSFERLQGRVCDLLERLRNDRAAGG